MDDSIWQIIIVSVLVLLSAFFSASETALVSVSRIKLRSMVEDNIKGAIKIRDLLDNAEKMLSATLISKNITKLSTAAFITSIVIKNENISVALGVGIIAAMIFVLIVIEITSKTLATHNSESVSIFVVHIISFFVFVFGPLIAALNFIPRSILKLMGKDLKDIKPMITESEIKTMVNVGHQAGVLEGEERQMIYNVFDFGDASAKDVMTPRTDLVSADVNSTYDELIKLFKEEMFSRIPVFDEHIDNIIGIISFKDLAFLDIAPEEFKVQDYMREPYYTYESKPTHSLFSIMRSSRVPMTIVLDEYGGTSGIITIEDLVEEIVGDISDEYDEASEEIVTVSDNEFIVAGNTKIDDLNEEIGTKLASDDYDSVGGYVIGLMGLLPDSGEEVISDGLKFVVENTDKNRIEKLRIIKLETEEKNDEQNEQVKPKG